MFCSQWAQSLVGEKTQCLDNNICFYKPFISNDKTITTIFNKGCLFSWLHFSFLWIIRTFSKFTLMSGKLTHIYFAGTPEKWDYILIWTAGWGISMFLPLNWVWFRLESGVNRKRIYLINTCDKSKWHSAISALSRESLYLTGFSIWLAT